MTRRALLALLVVCSAFGAESPAARADDGAFKIIVNPDIRATTVDRDFVRDAYLKKVSEWGDGTAIHPIDLSSKFPVREHFTHDMLRKSPAQLKAYWNQQIFSGKGTPPPEASSVSDVVSYVLEHEGAIGYVPVNADAGKARVIRVN